MKKVYVNGKVLKTELLVRAPIFLTKKIIPLH